MYSQMLVGLGIRDSIFAQSVEVKLDRVAQLAFDRLTRFSRRHAARQIGNLCTEVAFSFFNYDRISHQESLVSCACLRILRRVPAAKSSDIFPATVTRPRFQTCCTVDDFRATLPGTSRHLPAYEVSRELSQLRGEERYF
ncbi:MAG TPA: hypothetical protein VMT64_10730 [Candidatus Binataceae bacterium]|nr:hypothetical protein [Candidatus Binataceae bacterium]